jgi:hypothetical protein
MSLVYSMYKNQGRMLCECVFFIIKYNLYEDRVRVYCN